MLKFYGIRLQLRYLLPGLVLMHITVDVNVQVYIINNIIMSIHIVSTGIGVIGLTIII